MRRTFKDMKAVLDSYKSRLATGAVIAGCGAAVIGSADLANAAVLDAEFGFGVTLNAGTGSGGGSVIGQPGAIDTGNMNWTAFYGYGQPVVQLGDTSTEGFYNDEDGTTTGLVVYALNTATTTFGDGLFAAANGNATIEKASFASFSAADNLGVDVTGGVIGFLTGNGNWGYVEFDWNATSSELTILSAKVESVVGDTITFTPTVVPEPSALAMLSLGAVGLMMRRRRRVA